ncbi:MAG: hypothetical protein WCI67_02995 [Chloroflexales bacterium]
MRWAFEHGRWAFGLQKPHEYFSVWKPYTLWGTETRLQAPLLFIAGEDEIGNVDKALIQSTFRYLDALTTTVDFRLFSAEEGGSSHCQIGGMSGAQTATFEWLEKTLCQEPAKPLAADRRRIRMSPEFITVVQKHYGAAAAEPFKKFLKVG